MKMFISARLNEAAAKHEGIAKAVTNAAQRFIAGDWGHAPEEDKKANDRALLARRGHVLGRYKSLHGDLYINLEFGETEDDDTAVIMYRNEYKGAHV